MPHSNRISPNALERVRSDTGLQARHANVISGNPFARHLAWQGKQTRHSDAALGNASRLLRAEHQAVVVGHLAQHALAPDAASRPRDRAHFGSTFQVQYHRDLEPAQVKRMPLGRSPIIPVLHFKVV